MKRIVFMSGIILLLTLAGGIATAQDPEPKGQIEAGEKLAVPKDIDGGDTAWMLVSTGLVMFMVPGLALFYGGMVRRKNILGTMMHSMIALSLIGLQWVLFGYSLAFGSSLVGSSLEGWIGWDPKYVGLTGVTPLDVFPGTKIPILVHCMYQGMFAIITPALISGALAERVRFGPYCLFILLWAVLVYDPLAHWVWSVKAVPQPKDHWNTIPVGWLGKLNALDFAGGTVVHISAGFSALAAILLLRKRRGYPEHAMHPSSMVLTLLGAGLLWFGWFGFNGGSALSSGAGAGVALAATQIGAAAAAFSWLVCEKVHRGKPTALGFGSGLVAGLVAITPASGYVTPLSAIYIGLIAGVICYLAVSLKPLLKYDDSLDAFGVHGVGGVVGALLTGVFASVVFWGAANKPEAIQGTLELGALSVLEGGRTAQIIAQFAATVVSLLYAFFVTLVLVFVIDKVWGFNLDEKSETDGVDRSEHGETAFDLGAGMEMAAAAAPRREPQPAEVPPNGRRHFTVVVEGVKPAELIGAWSSMCGSSAQTPSLEFRSVYPFVTTVQGNRFNFRGGDPVLMREAMKALFSNLLEGTPIKTHVEN
jgi:ammonium transporter, Amt family